MFRLSRYLIGALLFGPTVAQAASPPPGRPLSSGWELRLPHTGWRPATVPGVFNTRPLVSEFTGTTGTYRLRFRTPSTPAGFGWGLRFEQARRIATVSLNGHVIGKHRDPYTQFQFALPHLRRDAVNTLEVRVDNHRLGPEPREGWWNWGGLTRPVSLIPLGPISASNVAVLPQLHCLRADTCSGSLLLDATLRNRTDHVVRPRLTVTLAPPAGGGSARRMEVDAPPLAAGARTALRASLPLPPRLQLWSPASPHLYRATVSTAADTQVAQLDELQVGMREVAVRDGLLFLNGRQIDMRGASIEEDARGHGPALTAADDDRIIAELQALHANVTRAQYPLDQALLSRLDRAGIMVWSQAPIYHRDALLHSASGRHAALATLRDTVLQTRTHPSVLTESVANELSPEPDSVAGTRSYLAAAAPLVRSLAPGTPVSVDLFTYPGFPVQDAYRAYDLLGINNYYGWYTGKRGHSTADIAGLAPFLRQTHERYPEQALVMSEFGAEANIGGPASQKQTYAFQTQYLQRTLGTVASLPFMSGAIYWTLREFAVKPHWDGGAHRHDIPFTSIHHKGLIAYDGRPKPAFGVAAQLFSETPFYRSPDGPTPVPPGGGSSGPPTGVWIGLAALLGGVGLALIATRRRGPRTREGELVGAAAG
ncbi:MAG: beta-glucuronidase [Solirubrobacteraceae bacterium]